MDNTVVENKAPSMFETSLFLRKYLRNKTVDPEEYKRHAENVKIIIAKQNHIPVSEVDNFVKMSKEANQIKEQFGKVGRNEKCPCGSNMKYKHCHGRYSR